MRGDEMSGDEMTQLFELHSNPELDAPVLVIVLDGWIDAGYGAATALKTITDHHEMETIATFDADVLLDHRARRPTMHLDHGVNTHLTWPSIELKATVDQAGHDVLFLIGAEPDHFWRAFATAVTDLAGELGVSMVSGLGAYPAPVPHTRPTGIVATAATRELADRIGFGGTGRIDVPAGVSAAIELQGHEAGIPAVGLWAQVPHYASAMPYPAAAAALIDGMGRHLDVRFGSGSLVDEAAHTRTRLDELVSNSPEHTDLVRQLEQQVDDAEAGSITPISGDELAAEFERFLREQGS
jgi:hypothetical protein